MNLVEKKCIPCAGNIPPATDAEITYWLPLVSGWTVNVVNGVKHLTKTFQFKNFVGSIDFVNRIKDVAEAEGHHPDLHISWNKVRVENWTHAIRGLHENDFILAAKIDALL